MTLKDLKPGQSAVVKKLSGEGAVKRRIMDMGLTKGAELLVRKVAPLGDPLELTVRGYELSVRKADAEMIEVELRTRRRDMAITIALAGNPNAGKPHCLTSSPVPTSM